MKKIIAFILAAFFVLLSPFSAFASTTESMLMYAVVEDEYSVMPLSVPSSSYNFEILSGYYNKYTEYYTASFLSAGSVSNGSILFQNDYQGVGYTFNYENGIAPMVGFRLGVHDRTSSLSIPDGSTLRIQLNDIYFPIYYNDVEYYLTSNSVPFKCFADMHFTAMQVIGNTHSGTYHDQIVDISNFLVPTKTPPFDNDFYFDLDLQMPVIADQSNVDENIDRLYNINLRGITLYFVYDFSQYSNGALLSIPFNTQIFSALITRNMGTDSPYTTRVNVSYDANGSVGDSGTVSVLQSSISAVGSSINSQISQVKTQIVQSTNTINSRIDTMSTNIQQGLQNVVQSAQQNTQNIINTVTQKVDEVKTGITEVKDSILDLPNKIQEMLLGLIVPDSDTMADKYSEFSGLLEEKLGVIYQIPMMLFDFFDTIVNAATTPQTTLILPAFQLPWIDGSSLTVWQPMEYKIIPDGMQVLSDLIKTITSMTVVVLTFNSVKRAYERFLRS